MISTTALPVPDAATSLRGPFRLAVAMLVVTTITILWGAMTTSTGSGLVYLDWPTSDGQLMPESSYTTLPGFLEHFHRLFGATAGALSLSLAIWLHVGRGLDGARSAPPGARATAWGGLGLIIVQGVVGGVGVRLGLPAVTSVTHGILAQLTLATFAWIAYQLSNRYRETAPVTTVPPGSGRTLALLALLVVVAQTVLGAVARHTNNTNALWAHAGNALVVFVVATIATAYAVGKLGGAPGIKRIAQAVITLLILQIALGFVALVIRNAAGKTPENVANLATALVISVHVLFGALLTVLMATLAAHVFRATRPPTSSGDVA
ncbi:MAG TPA: COX15/CtaA family protein [Planctomycetota bacterium]|nr:COX15/CtaA family protein [Planctomycetota bacterium]